jgi:DNA processing protein
VTACDRCLRRGALLRALVPWIARALDEHRRLPAVLALEDDELVDAVCGAKRGLIDAELEHFDPAAARSEALAAGLTTVCRHEDRFPPRLLNGPDAVAALWLGGEAERLAGLARERPVALVGARRASAYGLEVARGLGRELAVAGVPVVSGMALGIDSAAHERVRSRPAASPSPCSPAEPTSLIRARVPGSTAGSQRRASSYPSCRRARARIAGPSPRATGSWPGSPR